MYKFKITITDKHTHNQVIETSNKLSRMMTVAKQCKNSLYVIKNAQTDKIISRGSK